MRPIDRFLPYFDVNEVHAVSVTGSAETVYRTILSLDFAKTPVIRYLFRLRGMPSTAIGLQRLLSSGFILLADHPGQSMVLGLVGRFWRPTGQLMPIAPDNFRRAAPAGCAKAVWDFEIRSPAKGTVRLSTETRILCPDAYSRKRFRLYWLVIGPFSAWIRREMLRAIKARVEEEARRENATASP
jgi:hypothetical protein